MLLLVDTSGAELLTWRDVMRCRAQVGDNVCTTNQRMGSGIKAGTT